MNASNSIKYFQLLDTDFYQMSMTLAYILNDDADDIVGFEGFYRHPKIAVSKGSYIFSGEDSIKKIIAKIQGELIDPNLSDAFMSILRHKIPPDKFDSFYQKVSTFFSKANTSFEVSIYPEGETLPPYVPFFQYKGPKWIGQLLETIILCAVNGKTGFRTQAINKTNFKYIQKLERLVLGDDPDRDPLLCEYVDKIHARAEEYKAAARDTIILDASFRRAPSVGAAMFATKAAIGAGWDGTSNVGAAMRGIVDVSKTGGTHAHSFIMSNAMSPGDHEINAFFKWDRVFPGTTLLIDTYDVESAINKLLLAVNRRNFCGVNITKPSDIRIDSEPLEDYAISVRSMLDNNMWGDVGIFLSGDLTPERLDSFFKAGVPFNKTMAGTKFINCFLGDMVNCGFVYKIVEIENGGKKVYPEKKSSGKSNYSGLKSVVVKDGTMTVDTRPDKWGIHVSPFSSVRWKKP